MTATTSSRLVIKPANTCPLSWCSVHLGDTDNGLHQRWLSPNSGPLQIVLERQDWNGIEGQLSLSIRYSRDGTIADDVLDLPLDALQSALADRDLGLR